VRALFLTIGGLALAAGASLWWLARPAPDTMPDIAPAALFGAPFTDAGGVPHTLGEFDGQVIVVNFWATWCAPCREEMPAFQRLHERWAGRGVRFVGLSEEESGPVKTFASRWGIRYPLWIGATVGELGQRLGNRTRVLPFTVVIDRRGRPAKTRVGAYSEGELDAVLAAVAERTP
jgi:thiol-disulfide isomerase/thioredoxin